MRRNQTYRRLFRQNRMLFSTNVIIFFNAIPINRYFGEGKSANIIFMHKNTYS